MPLNEGTSTDENIKPKAHLTICENVSQWVIVSLHNLRIRILLNCMSRGQYENCFSKNSFKGYSLGSLNVFILIAVQYLTS